MSQNENGKITKWLNDEIKRHKIWRSIWSVLFFTTALLTIVTGALTTAVAGLAGAFDWTDKQALMWATILAAATTILAGMEKILRLREKWDLHRNIEVELHMINLKRGTAHYDQDAALTDIAIVARQYSSQLSSLTAAAEDDSDDTA